MLFPSVSRNHRSEYLLYRFFHNNLRILLLSAFLVFEQFVYGAFIAEEGSTVQHLYYGTAGLMFFFAVASFLFHRLPPQRSRRILNVYEVSLAACGLAVALIRVLTIETEVFRIPAIFIAVLYGMAVIFYFPYWQSLLLYTVVSTAALLLLPRYQPNIQVSNYAADIISNAAIAWIISVINYRHFVHDFLNKKIIEAKNIELSNKNRQLREANRELEDRSIRDGLTGLYNRRKLESVLEEVYRRAERYGPDFTVMIIDVDRFKQVNDNHGHDAGDLALRDIAALLCGNIREVDVSGRWGGEEFMIICPETDLPHGLRLGERLRSLIENSCFGEICSVTASFGIAAFSEFRELEAILKAADNRLYQAKENGRNRVEPAVPSDDLGLSDSCGPAD